jgi:hypothetical protein
VLLEKESYGGRNVWGSDPVPTAGAYTKGGLVTRENYAAYRAAVKVGTAGRQGVGPTQLTYGPFQDQADLAGGCWDWRANVLTGFGILASLIRVAGEQDGFRRYNGSGDAAQAYGKDAVTKLEVWRRRLAGQSTVTQEVDMPLNDDDKRWILQAIQSNNAQAAQSVWAQPVQNVKGEWPAAATILAAAEGRAWDVQDRVYEIRDDVRGLPDHLIQPTATGGVDIDHLADLIVTRMAQRLGGT